MILLLIILILIDSFGRRRLLWLSVRLLWQDRLHKLSRAILAHYDLIFGLLVRPSAMVNVQA